MPSGLDARQRLEAYQAARRDAACAETLLDNAVAASDAAPAEPAHEAGVELARRRLRRAIARLEAAFGSTCSG